MSSCPPRTEGPSTVTAIAVATSLRREDSSVGSVVTSDGERPDVFHVTGVDSDVIGRRSIEAGIELHELTPQHETLETIFMALTQDAVQYHSHGAPAAHPSVTIREAA